MIIRRPASERGHEHHGWLDSWHSFPFGNYSDARHVPWGPLRVINEDRVQAAQGFGTHGHRDMEIISYVIAGELGHKDSMGNAASILPGEVQRMSAGTGLMHSEFNVSTSDSTHFLQIWIMPSQLGLPPSYEQRAFGADHKRGRLQLVISPDGRAESLTVHQDVCMYAGLFDADEQAALALAPGRLGYVHLVRGQARVNGQPLVAGDALLYRQEPEVHVDRATAAEVLVFDLPR